MPKRNCAGGTKSVFGSAFCWFMAFYADFNLAIRKIFSMYFPMTGNAKRDAVINIKLQIKIFSKRFYMMSMDFFIIISTFLASIVIPFKNVASPCGKIIPNPCPFSLKGFSIFPSRGIFPNHVGSRTLTRTKFAVSIFNNMSAVQTYFTLHSMRPTFFRTIFRGITSICMLFIFSTTNRTFKNNTRTSFINWISFYCRHIRTLTYHEFNGKHYCDVIVKRWENFTGKKATLQPPL